LKKIFIGKSDRNVYPNNNEEAIVPQEGSVIVALKVGIE